MTKTSTKLYNFNGVQMAFVAMVVAFIIMAVGMIPNMGSEVFAENGTLVIDGTGATVEADAVVDKTDVNKIIATAILAAKVLGGLVIAVAVLVIVMAGFKYAASQGDPKATEGAKSQIISAGIGMAIAIMAIVIVQIFGSIFGL